MKRLGTDSRRRRIGHRTLMAGLALGTALGLAGGAPSASAQVFFYTSVNPSGVRNHICHAGVWFDYDGDGIQDLLLTTETGKPGQGGYPRSNRLYKTSIDGGGNVSFQDVSQASGIENTNHASNGALAADVNNDGEKDLFIMNQYHTYMPNPPQNFLYLANGDGTFTESAAAAGVLGEWHNMGCSAVDYNGDGWLDLFVGQVPQKGESYVPNILYHNLGTSEGGFVPTFENAGFDVLEQPYEATYAAAWSDYDLDGYPDAYVCNAEAHYSTTGNDVLAHNEGGVSFTQVTGVPFNDVPLNGYAAWGDYDDDGDPDVYVSNWATFGEVQVHDWGQLYRNEFPQPTFTNVSASLGIEVPSMQGAKQFTPAWMDFDNDGDLDLWVATNEFFGNMILRNELVETGTATFTDVSLLSGAWDQVSQMSSSVVDVNQDGWLDVLTTKEQFGLSWLSARLHLNLKPWPSNHWLRLDLEGCASARTALGAVVDVSLPTNPTTTTRVVGDGFSSFSGGESTLHFGLKDDAQADRVSIAWPSGVHQTLRDVPADGAAQAVVEQGIRQNGVAAPGESFDVEIAGPAGDLWLLWYGAALGTPAAMPPFGGRIELDLAQPVLLLGSGTIPPSRLATFPITLLNLPSLSGLSLYFQSLQGAFPPSSNMSWWDALTVTIQ